jgi:hypothetical protein
MKLLRINEMVLTAEVTPQTTLDILFDMGAKIVSAKHDVGQSEIIFEYNNQTASLYYFVKKKSMQIVHKDVIMKSMRRINEVEDMVHVLTDLLKRIF